MNLLQTFHLAVIEYLYRGRRMVPLQTFTTRHSNRKLSIVIPLSTTFMQCAPENTKFGKITQKRAVLPFKVIQGHRFWYQTKAHVQLLIKTIARQVLHMMMMIQNRGKFLLMICSE